MIKINVPKDYYAFNTERILEKHGEGVKYIGDFAIKDGMGEWHEKPVAVFYQPHPDKSKGHSHYFGLFCTYKQTIKGTEVNKILITNGESAFDEGLTGVYNKSGDEILISGWRHNYRELEDGTMIDGGRDYTRYNQGSQLVKVEVIDGEFKIKND